MRLAKPLAVLLCAASALATGCSSAPAAQPNAAPSNLASLHQQYGLPSCPDTALDTPAIKGGLPKTRLPCLGTEQQVNLAGLPRQAYIINFWAQWCGPCREESPHLREALSMLPQVQFLGVNYNDPQPDWAIEFAGLVQWKYPHVQDQDKTLQTQLKISGIPTTLFVTPDGTIVYTQVGPFTSTQQILDLAAKHLASP